jgi:isoleucyl-tRNA synthetase
MIYLPEQILGDIYDVDWAEICITSNAMVTILRGNDTPPSDAFRLAELADVGVVVEKAQGTKCARSWKILPTIGDDKEYPDVSPRDAQALREWKALGAVVS